MSRFSIVSSVYNEYEILRQFIESIIYNVDPETYEKVVIVDDFSWNKGILRKYENYINSKYDKLNIINFDEYRYARWYQNYNQPASETFDPSLFDTDRSSLGVVKSYQLALEHVNTEFVVICDTDCVFLSKFKSTLNTIAKLYDEYPQVMSISQLQGHASDEIFESDIVGCKNMPGENGAAGGPSPMFSTFRIEAWTKHHLVPIASDPGIRRGNGFIDFFLSVIARGFKVANFPFFSKDHVYHIGGGTARRNTHNQGNPSKVGFGSLNATTYRYGARGDNYVYDYYAGAHRIDMHSDAFANYLKNKYNIPIDTLAEPFDESMLIKFKLHPKREVGFRPIHPVPLARMKELTDDDKPYAAKTIWWDRYTYGRPSNIDWRNE
jgi:hypothetical protein